MLIPFLMQQSFCPGCALRCMHNIFGKHVCILASLRAQSLEYAIGCLIHFIFLAFYLLIWNVDIVKGFSTFSAMLLAFTFIFGNSVK